jgi:hypothetical protein
MSYDITINQGQDFKLLITLKDPNGDAIDLTNATFEGMVRNSPQAGAPIYQFSFDILDQNTDTGKVSIIMEKEITSQIKLNRSESVQKIPTNFAYDVFYELNGIRKLVIDGLFIVRPSVTR